MPSFRLSDRARADLVDIYDFTEANFGVYQADAYHACLERTFGLLADFPPIGQSADELRASHRRFRFQSHYVLADRSPTVGDGHFETPRELGNVRFRGRTGGGLAHG